MKTAKNAYDVLAIGAAVRDIFVRSSAFETTPDKKAPDGFDTCLMMGAKVPVDELVYASGGGATNAAVTFARWGLRTAAVGRVGNDFHARDIVAELKREHIDIKAMQTDHEHPTGTSIILLAGSGHRAILTARGAGKDIDPKQIPWSKLNSRWIYMTSFAGNLKLLDDVFAHARKTLARVAWNPGNAEIHLGLKKLGPYVLHCDILILNREEAAELTDRPPRDLEGILNVLGPMPRTALVITDGSKGAYAHANGTTWFVEPAKGKRINTTGAGDAFGSGFTAGVIRTGDIEKALRCASLNATGVVTHMGAKTGILHGFPTPAAQRKVRTKQLP